MACGRAASLPSLSGAGGPAPGAGEAGRRVLVRPDPAAAAARK